MTDSEKLIALADWYDLRMPGNGDEVQQDLRRIANELISLRAENERLKELLSQTEAVQDKTALILKSQSIEILRKRCEDLEAEKENFRKICFEFGKLIEWLKL